MFKMKNNTYKIELLKLLVKLNLLSKILTIINYKSKKFKKKHFKREIILLLESNNSNRKKNKNIKDGNKKKNSST